MIFIATICSSIFQPCLSKTIAIPESLSKRPEDITRYILAHTNGEEEFVETLYQWICENIRYSKVEIDSLTHLDLVHYVLAAKQGRCIHYSALLTCVCNMAGIEAYSVLGYVKQSNSIETTKDHAWNVIRLNNTYYLFDPTWDTGSDKLSYYKKQGDYFLETHMPYDPMMQLSNYPVRHPQYFRGKRIGRQYFDFESALKEYSTLNQEEQLKLMLFRAETYGINSFRLGFLYIRLKHFVEDYSDCQFTSVDNSRLPILMTKK